MRWLKCAVFDSFAVAIANAGGQKRSITVFSIVLFACIMAEQSLKSGDFFRPCSNRSDLVAVIDVQHFVSTVQRSGHDP
jgi:hypothetical protein